ncbi:MAG: DUF421 domain-containing protein [Bacillota bacterium]
MLIIFFRTLVLYILVVFVMRVMGKRQIGQLQPFELVIAILIADLAAVPMADKEIPLINGIIPILTLLVAQVFLSTLNMKSIVARRVICGKPSLLVENGKIVERELDNLRYNLHDLLEQIRTKGYFNLADVEFAILETNGTLNVIPKSQKRPICPGDLAIDTPYEGMPLDLIIDGKIIRENLQQAGLTGSWLEGQLAGFGIRSAGEVLIASLDTKGDLYFQKKGAAS